MTNPTASTSQVTTSQVVHLDFIALSATATAEAVEDLIAEAAGLTELDSVLIAGVIRTASATPEALEARSAQPMEPGAQPTLSRVGAPPHAQSASAPSSPTSDFDLAFFFVLDGFTSLEPFGTDARYIRFLQGKVARLLRGFAGADVALTAPFPAVQPFATCLALMAPEQTYDWEVRSALESWTQQNSDRTRAEPGRSGPGVINTPDATASPDSQEPSNAIGLAIGERQRYRGCVLSFTTAETTPERPADRRFESTLIAGHATRLQA